MDALTEQESALAGLSARLVTKWCFACLQTLAICSFFVTLADDSGPHSESFASVKMKEKLPKTLIYSNEKCVCVPLTLMNERIMDS